MPALTPALLDQPLACVDLETTGTNANWDRITEVGIVTLTDGVIEEWSSLVDPECRIPPAIESLTGISSAMVRGAPTFASLADELEARLAGRLFIAHNARFDYSFLKAEFGRRGMKFQPRVLCTARLSRRLFPEFQRHNLDALIGRYGLDCAARHRALGDAQVLVAFLARLRAEVEPERLEAALLHQLQRPTLPAHLDSQAVESLPDLPGVYILYGADDAVLYVGKSVKVRTRVKSHFGADSREPKELRLAQEVRRIGVERSAGELGALLRESRLVKELAPIYNRRLRRSRDFHTLHWVPDLAAPTAPAVVPLDADAAPDARELFGVWRTKREAQRALIALAEEHALCRKVLGLESGPGPCFARQLKRCQGACVGAESAAQHALRLHGALTALRLKSWPFQGRIGLRERSADGLMEELHVFDHWRWVGSATDAERAAALWTAPPGAFDLDTYKILVRELAKPGRFELVEKGSN
jgi:DNA polymerase-3 subunit epsilon